MLQHNFIELSKLLWWMIFTSNLYFWLPMLVLCFCQKLSGLIRWAVWIALGKYSWSTLRIGFTVDQADPDPPRISIMTVNPRSRTSSLKKKEMNIQILYFWDPIRFYTIPILWWNFIINTKVSVYCIEL